MSELVSDASAMLPPGDFARLDKRQREAFAKMQERMIGYLVEQANVFGLDFPQFKVHFAFQAEVYANPQEKPSTIRYSNKVF